MMLITSGLLSSFVALSFSFSAYAWVPPTAPTTSTTTPTTLAVQKQSMESNQNPLSAFFIGVAAAGWIVSSQVACASDAMSMMQTEAKQPFSSMILAAGAYSPEESFSSLDMSMPSYAVRDGAELLGGPSASSTTPPPTRKKSSAPMDPETEAQMIAKAKAEKAKKIAEAQARAKKYAETQAKMEAKKAERTAMQQKRNQVLAPSAD